MPVQKMINVLKILFAALSVMFLLLYISLLQRQSNAVTEAAAKSVSDTNSLLSHVPLSPVMALIPMIVCIVFTIFLFVMGAKEKKKDAVSKPAQTEPHITEEKGDGNKEEI